MFAWLGCAQFAYRSSGRFCLPAVRGRPLLLVEGEAVVLVEEDGLTALLLDHREGTEGPAFVEYWVPVSPTEAPVDGLLVIADAHRNGRQALPVGSFADAVRELVRAGADAASARAFA